MSYGGDYGRGRDIDCWGYERFSCKNEAEMKWTFDVSYDCYGLRDLFIHNVSKKDLVE